MENDNFILDWHYFSQYLLHKNRYFCVLPIVKKIVNYVNENIETISTKTDMFRARIIGDDMLTADFFAEIVLNESKTCPVNKTKDFVQQFCNRFKNGKDEPTKKRINDIQNGFYGYDKNNSSAPPEDSIKSHGRANPDYISYLYLAADSKTAISEIRPNPDDRISVALFRANKQLKLARLYCNRNKECTEPLTNNEKMGLQLSCVYSSVANKSSDYYATQYVSELIKNLGFDGLVYKSSICKDKLNYVIFDKNLCTCLSSDLYKVDKVEYISTKKFPFET